jgi:hypothetical protein
MNKTPPIALKNPLGLRRRMPDEFAHQVVAHGVDELPGLEEAEPVQQLRHLQGHRGLAGPRLAGEAHMQARPGRIEAEPAPGAVDQQERGDLLDLVFHRDEPDQLVVQVGEDLIHAGGLALVGQGDAGVWVQQRGGPAGPAGGSAARASCARRGGARGR